MGKERLKKMNVDVKIDAEQINKMVASAILNSVIGKEINEAINKFIKSCDQINTWNNPITKAVESEIRKQIAFIINNEYKCVIEQKIKKCITDDVVSSITAKAWEYYTSR